MDDQQINCPVEKTIKIIGNKWSILILKHLFEKTMRFNEFQKNIPGISTKMLSQQLKKLEKDGLLSRRVYPQVPPRVEYSLTQKGQTLKDVMDKMKEWGEKYAD